MDFELFKQLSFGASFKKKSSKSSAGNNESNATENSKLNTESSIMNSKKTLAALDFFGNSSESKEAKEKDEDGKAALPKSSAATAVKEKIKKRAPMSPEQIKAFRNENQIKLYEDHELVPAPYTSIEDLCSSKAFKKFTFLKQALTCPQGLGYTSLSPIQMQAIPIILSKRELIACAPTGSGKSMAFILPLIASLKEAKTDCGFRALIITPTMELANQIYREFQKVLVVPRSSSDGKQEDASDSIIQLPKHHRFQVHVLNKFNGHSFCPQEKQKCMRQDVLISTPLRLVQALKEGHITLNSVRQVILDEADKLLEEGFLEQVDEIMAACNQEKLYRALFSATITSSVEELSKTFMNDPVRVVIGTKHAAANTVEQKLIYTGSEEGKLIAIRQMIIEGFKPPVLIFVQSIERAKELFHELVYEGIHAEMMHGDRTASERENAIKNFRLGKIWVLIATDLMARGIDFKGVATVINYDFPQSHAAYIHRIGRTGRAGRSGQAITFFTRDDVPYLRLVVNVMRESGCEVPDWMLDLKPLKKSERSQIKKKPIFRKHISTLPQIDRKKAAHKRHIIEQSSANKMKRSKTSTKDEETPVAQAEESKD